MGSSCPWGSEKSCGLETGRQPWCVIFPPYLPQQLDCWLASGPEVSSLTSFFPFTLPYSCILFYETGSYCVALAGTELVVVYFRPWECVITPTILVCFPLSFSAGR